MFLPSCSGTVLLEELEMPAAKFPAVLVAIAPSAALRAAPGLVAAVLAAATPTSASALEIGDLLSALAAKLTQVRALLETGYARAPALVAVLLAFLVLPVAALVAHLVRSTARRRARLEAARMAQLRAPNPDAVSDAVVSAPLWQRQAWLSFEGSGAQTLPLAGQMIRIGRHRDNDICLPDASVHRYHAVIEHSEEEAFVITDLSGKDGNGLRINGERLDRALLADGDVIELGRTRLKFESAPI
jgi:hypothetical protein